MGAISILGVGHCHVLRFLTANCEKWNVLSVCVSLPDVYCRARAEAVGRMI